MTTSVAKKNGFFEQDRNLVDRRYVLRREVGRGGTCVVHEAVHRITHRVVAVKRLVDALRDNPVQRARLVREAEALASIDHPGVVSILDAGEESDGAPFIVLEFIEGRSLEGMIAARGRLDVQGALSILRQACDAVGAVHAAGLVHRDVKPGNMLLVAAGGSYSDLGATRLKLVDLGVASAPWFDAKLTKPEGVVGTPEYLPLESIGAEPGAAAPAADVYALGVTLFECLTGKVPFAGGAMQVMAQTMTATGPALEELRPDVPPVVARIVHTAMSRDPSKRYRDAHAMGAAIDDALAELSRTKTTRPSVAAGGLSRRRAARAAYITPVRVEFAGGAQDGRTEDLSEGGALVMLPESLEDGTQVQVRFALPMTGELLKAAALVRWSKRRDSAARMPCAIGLEFSGIDVRSRDAIAQFVRIVGGEDERRA